MRPAGDAMTRRLGLTTLVVDDYDAAIAFFVDALGFRLVADQPQGDKRWVVVSPGGGADVLLARAATPQQRARIGDQTGGRVAYFLYTDDFWRDYHAFRARGVVFVRDAPRTEPYGTVAVFRDISGNEWDLIEPAASRDEGE